MTRPIIFRAWDTEGKRMLSPEIIQILSANGKSVNNNEISFWKITDGLGREYEKTILLEFTGLLDKNGKEIYEGDVLSHENYGRDLRWVVEYRTDIEHIGFVPVTRHDGISPFMSYKGCEIIGNIYENPELIKETP